VLVLQLVMHGLSEFNWDSLVVPSPRPQSCAFDKLLKWAAAIPKQERGHDDSEFPDGA